MIRVFLDLNVILDVLMEREPHAETAAALWAAIETRQAEGLIAAHCVTTLYYLARKSGGEDYARRCVEGVLAVFDVVPLDAAILKRAQALRGPDLEDAVCAVSAVESGCHMLVTRDARGFRMAQCPVFSPHEALAALRVSTAK